MIVGLFGGIEGGGGEREEGRAKPSISKCPNLKPETQAVTTRKAKPHDNNGTSNGVANPFAHLCVIENHADKLQRRSKSAGAVAYDVVALVREADVASDL